MQEYRSNSTVTTENRTVSGLGIVVNSLSEDLGNFREIIRPSALDGVIENNDIVFVLEHSTEKGVLARSRYGEGSLKLWVDSRGLNYEFEAPQTALGDELLEGLRRGDLSSSSFKFIVGEETWSRMADGTPLREIHSFKAVYDISCVAYPAYSETSAVCARGLQELDKNSDDDMSLNIEELRSKLDELEKLIASNKEENPIEEQRSECEEQKTDEEEREEEPQTNDEEVKEEEEETPNEEEHEERSVEPLTDEEENRNNINSNIRTMNKFSLLKSINDVVNGRSLDETAQAVNAEGRSAMNKSGLSANGNIVMPIAEVVNDEVRANGVLAQTVTAGQENIAEDKLAILEPLRANMILSQCGATYLTGLVGDVSIPVYSGSNVGWKGEAITADNGVGEWSEVTLTPKRLTAYIDISKQFLVQDGNDAEQMLRNDIVKALAEKLEQTIFGDGAGDATKPEGFFNGVVANTTNTKFENLVDAEAALEEKNVNNYVYVVSPSAKAILRKTAKDAGSGRFVMEDNEIEGREVYVSSVVTKKGIIVGDFKDYVVGSWGAIDITVDPYTKAADAMVRLVINAYFDAKPRRDSFVKQILK